MATRIARKRGSSGSVAAQPEDHFIRIGGLAIFLVRPSGDVDVLFPDADSGFFSGSLVPRHEPQIAFAESGKQQGLDRTTVLITAGTGNVTIKGNGQTPTDPYDAKTWDHFRWLPTLRALSPPGTLDSRLAPALSPFPKLPAGLSGLVRISGNACTLGNGGFAAGGSFKTRLQRFESDRDGFVTSFAESALLTVRCVPPLTAEVLDAEGKSVGSLEWFSKKVEEPDLLSSETTQYGSFPSDFSLYSLALQNPSSTQRQISEAGTVPWPTGLPPRLRGGRSAGRPVCPPVIGEGP